jgi:hypothetical protein
MQPTHTLDEIRAALAIEREIMGPRGGIVPVDEIRARAGFYPNNDERSRVEVADFIADPPDRYFAYHARKNRAAGAIVGAEITTWTGSVLARVISRGFVYRSNLGDRRQSFRAVAINGAVYSGIAYLDSGDYVRMRKVRPDAAESRAALAMAREAAA